MAKAGELLLFLVRKHLMNRSWTVLPTQVRLLTASAVSVRRDATGNGLEEGGLTDEVAVDAGILGAALAAKRAAEAFVPSNPSPPEEVHMTIDHDKKVHKNFESHSRSNEPRIVRFDFCEMLLLENDN